MNFDDQTFSQIASYLNNEMDEAEKASFETLLKNDAELASFMETFTTLDDVYNEEKWTVKSNATTTEIKELANQFRADDVLALSKKIRTIQENTQQTTAPKKKTYFYYISSAVALAAIFTLFYFSFLQPISPSSAFEQNHDWNTLPSFQTKSSTEDNLAEATTLFKEEKYQEALSIFTKYTEENNAYNPNVALYIGVSHLELQNYTAAIETFNDLKNSNALDAHKAYWYLALTYLKQEDVEKAKNMLAIIVQKSSNYNHEKAQKLLKKLK